MSSKTSDIGVIGELAVMAHLIELEYEVFKGITGAESADLIAYKNGTFTRVPGEVSKQQEQRSRVSLSIRWTQ